MKIEELKDKNIPKAEEEKKKASSYWFPLPKGYNRLLVVCGIIIPIIIACIVEGEAAGAAIVITAFFEVIIYIMAVWIYHGFKDSDKK